MIKKLKNFICKLFGIKQCACPEQDEHLEIYEETAKQKKIREKHKGETK
tara:strand:+ start:288 stop:434 length:147 start_codon:yes stop_codon:yes gene_type:complete